jgi:carboxyl-terminal processing protease
MMIRREWFLAFFSPLVLMALGAGIIILERRPVERTIESTPGIQLYQEVMNLARSAYVIEPDLERLVYGAAKGIVEHGLDEHCKVYDPAEWSDQRLRSRGEYAGIGVRIGRLTGQLAFLWVDPDGPSGAAGLRAGDKIVRINGLLVDHNLPAEEAAAPLRGPIGSRVEVTVIGLNQVLERVASVKRSLVEEHTAFGYLLPGSPRVGYVALTGFRDNTVDQYSSVLAELREGGVESLVMDLRGNRGGHLESAVEIVDRFLPSGAIVTTQGRLEAPAAKVARALSPESDLALVILTDGNTASASEVVAGALQDYGRAILLGERTYGKGVVQRVMPFSESGWDGGIKLTIAHYFTPAGRCIERRVALAESEKGVGGLTPDVVMSVSAIQRDASERLKDRARLPREIRVLLAQEEGQESPISDPQLEEAVAILRGSFEPSRPLK